MAPAVDNYRIRLDGIRFRGRHGASEAERYLLQDFVVDLEVELPLEVLPDSDERKAVYDYDALASLVVEEGTQTSYKLLETLARRLLERILGDTPASSATVRLRKFGPPTTVSVDTVSVELVGRSRPLADEA
jgi:dihydroneopterin aldolase